MSDYKPVLDRLPDGHPRNDWKYSRIMAAAVGGVPDEWENPYIKEVALRDQGGRGTCTGVSGACGFDLNYIKLTNDHPTSEDKNTVKRDVLVTNGVVHDVLFERLSGSGEAMYKGGRDVGHVTYPEGGELRYCVKYWRDTGMILEKDWFTSKTSKAVLHAPNNKDDAAKFQKDHKIDGWAIVDPDFDSVCRAIYEKGWCWIGIPVFESYGMMKGGDGWFPDKFNEVVGGHALIAYGYSKTGKTSRKGIKVLHTWGNYCNPYGGLSEEYFNRVADESDFFVVLDEKEAAIGKQTYWSLTVTAKDSVTKVPIPAKISVDGKYLGISPQKFAVERGGKYTIEVVMAGYTGVKRKYSMTAKKKLSLSLSLSLKKTPSMNSSPAGSSGSTLYLRRNLRKKS